MTLRIAIAATLLACGSFVQAKAPAPLPVATLKGEVLEVLQVKSFTYLRLRTRVGEVWASVPAAAVKQGAEVTLYNPTMIEGFESKSLKRRFDKIVFASLEDPAARAAGSGRAPSRR